MRISLADPSAPPVALGNVLSKEHAEIKAVRSRRLANFDRGSARPIAKAPERPVAKGAPAGAEAADPRTDDPDWTNTIRQAHEANYVGLAFSGGGIRSATFNLGVLQALADLKLLSRIDYLSTVSGGGYIGSWLIAWTKRIGSFARLQEAISTRRVHLKGDKEQPPVRFLRVFSNYLTPQLGVFSGDTWAMVAIYVRNLLLNQTILIAMLAAFLLLPRTVLVFACFLLQTQHIEHILALCCVVLLLLAIVWILANMAWVSAHQTELVPWFTEQKWVLVLAGAPLFVTAAVEAIWFTHWPAHNGQAPPWLAAILRYFPHQNEVQALGAAAVYTLIWVLAWVAESIFFFRSRRRTAQPAAQGASNSHTAASPLPRTVGDGVIALLAAPCAGALAGWLLAVLYHAQVFAEITCSITLGVPLVVVVFLLVGVLHIGLMGVAFRDWKREWWGRLGGWLLLFAILWLALFWLALYFPAFVTASPAVKSLWQSIAKNYLTPAWIVSTLATVLAGNSKSAGKPGQPSWTDTAIKVGPYIFIVGLLCWISFGLDWFLGIDGPLWLTLLVCAGVALFMAWRVDINQFSMHMFYRNRLVSCYLGASHEHRCPNRFTGFDSADDMPLKDLRSTAPTPYDGPYPVLNSSLNLVKGKDLAWQERKAESFVMTPYYCGYDVWLEEQDSPMLAQENKPPLEKAEDSAVASARAGLAPAGSPPQPESTIYKFFHPLQRYGYRATEDYAFPISKPGYYGPNLGLAMATSGAAVSPNMGYHSSAPVAFLLTVFNVRLGQWMGNPRHPRTSQRATPILGLWWLVNELLGGTNDQADYVYLSDGGHFDNMGLYELVKRRCGLIILCDAEADSDYTFSGLGGAISKCRIDLGIDIDLDTSNIAPKSPTDPSGLHCAVGTIHYENADVDARTGTIIYFKASLTGDEPGDVENYKKDHPTFPHESTADQWFAESQFESYRELGYHAVTSSIKGVPGVTPTKPAHALEKDLHTRLKDFGFDVG